MSQKEAKALWERAQKAIESSAYLLTSDPDAASSRAYYAAFYAVSAFFALEEKSFSKHTSVQAAVNKELIKTGKWAKHLGRAYSFLMELRDRADYGGDIHADKKEAEMALQYARSIAAAVRELAPDQFCFPPSG